MADRIKGITIEINGDTVKLSKALEGVNQKISSTSASLKDVNRLLKLDPGNTDLLKQKQEYLNTSIEATKEKLQQEKEALEQMQASGSTEVNQEQQNALQREIVETTQKLEKLEEQNKHFSVLGSQISDVGDKISEVGGKITGVGAGLSKSVTAPIAAIGTASMAAWGEVDEALDTITQKTGASGDALADMQDRAKELATTIPVSFQDAGTAIGEVNTRFASTGEELSDLSEKFLKFSNVNGTDVNATIDQTSASMKAWNLEAKDAGAYLDTLNVVGQATGINVDALNASMASNATTFKEMKMSAADAATFLGQVEVSGMDSSTAMKGLQTAMKNAVADGKALPDVLKDLQDKMGGSATDTEKLNACIETFGSKAGPQFYNALKNGTVNLDDFGSSINDNLGSVSDTFDAMLDPADQAQVAMNNLKEVGAQLGDSLQATLAPIIERVVGKIRDFKDWFDSLDDSTKQMIVTIGLVAAVIGPLIVLIGTIVSSIGGLLTNYIGPLVTFIQSSLIPAIGAISAPVLAVVAVLAAFAAAFIYLYKTNDEFRAKVQVIWLEIQDTIQSVIQAVQAIIQAFVVVVQDAWAKWGDQIMAVVNTAWNFIMAQIELVMTIIEGVINVIMAAISGDWSGAWNAIKQLCSDVWDGIKNVVSAALEFIKTFIQTCMNVIKSIISTVWNAIKSVFSTVLESIKQTVTDVWNSIKQTISDVINAIKDTVSEILGNIADKFTEIFENIKSGVAERITAVKEVITDKIGEAMDFLKNLPAQALTWGRDLIDNFVQGIKDTVHKVTEAVEGVANKVSDVLGFSEPEEGPLSDFHTYAPDMIDLFVKGINDNMYKVQQAVEKMAGNISMTVNGASMDRSATPIVVRSVNTTVLDGKIIAQSVNENLGAML